MIAITRSASRVPSSMSLASSLASATEWIGTLRTSIADGTGASFHWVVVDPGELAGGHDPRARPPLDGLGDALEGRDDADPGTGLGEGGDGLDLGSHRPGREPLLGAELSHLGRPDLTDGP